MKKIVAILLSMGLAFCMLAGCANNDTSGKTDVSGNYSDEMKIPYAEDLSPEDGADSVERLGDHQGSPYFAHPDVYNMEPTETLSVLTNFRTMQQTNESACGITSALMVLDWYDKLGDWTERSLGDLRHTPTGDLEGYPGTTLQQAIDIFDGVGGFDYQSTIDTPVIWMEDIKAFLDNGIPVMICWNDWGGHWRVIIGYDNMGTETEQDDVFLTADPYDTTDHNQDGYGVLEAERMMYNFSMYGYFPEEEGGSDMLYLAAWPQD